jgi:hypothetical protein
MFGRLPNDELEFDLQVCEYVEAMWAEGEAKGLVASATSMPC